MPARETSLAKPMRGLLRPSRFGHVANSMSAAVELTYQILLLATPRDATRQSLSGAPAVSITTN